MPYLRTHRNAEMPRLPLQLPTLRAVEVGTLASVLYAVKE
jgi:hypothetical protein